MRKNIAENVLESPDIQDAT